MYFNRFWDANLSANEEVIKIIQKQLQEPKTALVSSSLRPGALRQRDGLVPRSSCPAFGKKPSFSQPADIGFIWWDVWATGCGGGAVAKPEALKSHVRMGRESIIWAFHILRPPTFLRRIPTPITMPQKR